MQSQRMAVWLSVGFAFFLLAGCRENEAWFPEPDLTAIREGVQRLACTIRHANLDEYGKMLHSGYHDGFLYRDAKLAQMKILFNTGMFYEYTLTSDNIVLDNDKAIVAVTEQFLYDDARRQQQDRQEWREENGTWRIYRQWQPDPSLPLAGQSAP